MSILNMPMCDMCHGVDIGDVCVAAYDIDTHEDLMVCPDCMELYEDHLREPGDVIDHVYEMMRDAD